MSKYQIQEDTSADSTTSSSNPQDQATASTTKLTNPSFLPENKISLETRLVIWFVRVGQAGQEKGAKRVRPGILFFSITMPY